jgi:hypothetical protein
LPTMLSVIPGGLRQQGALQALPTRTATRPLSRVSPRHRYRHPTAMRSSRRQATVRARGSSSCPKPPRTPPDATVRRGLCQRQRPRRHRSLPVSCWVSQLPDEDPWLRSNESGHPSEATTESVPCTWPPGSPSGGPSEATTESVVCKWPATASSGRPSAATTESVVCKWPATASSGRPSAATTESVVCTWPAVSWSPGGCWKRSGAPGRLGWSRPSRNGTRRPHYAAPRQRRAGRRPPRLPTQPRAPLPPSDEP